MNDINTMSIGEFLSNNDDEKYIAKDIVDDEYIMLHQLYKTAFSDYLLSNSSLKEYKSLLKNEGLLPVPEDDTLEKGVIDKIKDLLKFVKKENIEKKVLSKKRLFGASVHIS